MTVIRSRHASSARRRFFGRYDDARIEKVFVYLLFGAHCKKADMVKPFRPGDGYISGLMSIKTSAIAVLWKNAFFYFTISAHVGPLSPGENPYFFLFSEE
jgi:hypothetical protein